MCRLAAGAARVLQIEADERKERDRCLAQWLAAQRRSFAKKKPSSKTPANPARRGRRGRHADEDDEDYLPSAFAETRTPAGGKKRGACTAATVAKRKRAPSRNPHVPGLNPGSVAHLAERDPEETETDASEGEAVGTGQRGRKGGRGGRRGRWRGSGHRGPAGKRHPRGEDDLSSQEEALRSTPPWKRARSKGNAGRAKCGAKHVSSEILGVEPRRSAESADAAPPPAVPHDTASEPRTETKSLRGKGGKSKIQKLKAAHVRARTLTAPAHLPKPPPMSIPAAAVASFKKRAREPTMGALVGWQGKKPRVRAVPAQAADAGLPDQDTGTMPIVGSPRPQPSAPPGRALPNKDTSVRFPDGATLVPQPVPSQAGARRTAAPASAEKKDLPPPGKSCGAAAALSPSRPAPNLALSGKVRLGTIPHHAPAFAPTPDSSKNGPGMTNSKVPEEIPVGPAPQNGHALQRAQPVALSIENAHPGTRVSGSPHRDARTSREDTPVGQSRNPIVQGKVADEGGKAKEPEEQLDPAMVLDQLDALLGELDGGFGD